MVKMESLSTSLPPSLNTLMLLAPNSVSVVCRDRKRKRFVCDAGRDDQKKKLRLDSGQVIGNKKNKKNLYPLCGLFLPSIFSGVVEMLYHLTTRQLRGVEEKIQGQ